MNELIVHFNEQDYILAYNEQSGYYEIDLLAPEIGGIYNVDIEFTDLLEQSYEKSQVIQILAQEEIKIETNEILMWIFDIRDFLIKDIVELSDYEINIDEETNANSIIKVLKKTTAEADDIVFIKKNGQIIYWGIIDKISNENGGIIYEYTLKYITNIFDEKVEVIEEQYIRERGIEDFLEHTINKHFIENIDEFTNKTYLEVRVLTHTKLEKSVDNAENGIYNLHTFMTNCTQNYDIVYNFFIENKKLVITIGKQERKKVLLNVKAQAISNYNEVFETSVVSKVVVKTSTGRYVLYLLNDRTTTEDMSNVNRAKGRTERTYTEKDEDAKQTALDVFKQNSYNHNVTFKYNKYVAIGTPIAIKTKESVILDTYISALKITQEQFIEYTCGNIRTKFIDKLLKERKD